MSGNTFFHANPLFEDPILKTGAKFAVDKDPRKVNVGIGAYRDENGQPIIMECVKAAEKFIIDHPKEFLKEYPPMVGNPEFLRLGAELLFGKDHPVIKEGRVASVHCIAGSGSLYIGMKQFHHQFPNKPMYFPDITWSNHVAIWDETTDCAERKTYRFFKKETMGIELEGLLEDFEKMPERSFILMHACAHNPTGADFTHEEWNKVLEVVKRRDHVIFFDAAYPGFSSGDIERDLYAPRLFAKEGIELVVAQSFSKILGLYGERCGICHIIHRGDKLMTTSLVSDMGKIARCTWSMPPIHGGDIVRVILRNPEMREAWNEELKKMTGRILRVRRDLVDELNKIKCPSPLKSGNWDHILRQTGMFSYLGLAPNQCRLLVEKYHVYLLESSRISMCGLNKYNMEYFASCIKAVMLECKPGK